MHSASALEWLACALPFALTAHAGGEADIEMMAGTPIQNERDAALDAREDEIFDWIENGDTLYDIARRAGVHRGALTRWLNKTEERTERFARARANRRQHRRRCAPRRRRTREACRAWHGRQSGRGSRETRNRREAMDEPVSGTVIAMASNRAVRDGQPCRSAPRRLAAADGGCSARYASRRGIAGRDRRAGNRTAECCVARCV